MGSLLKEDNYHLVSRLRTQMLRRGLNPKTLAERANVGRSFVYDILSGKSTNPTSSKISAVAEELGVSVQYLLRGVHAGIAEGQREWSDVVEISTLQVEDSVSGSMVVTVGQKERPYYYRGQWVKDHLGVRAEDLRVITVSGDSMSPTLTEGDVVLIDLTKRNPTPAGVFVLFDGVGLVTKRLEVIASGKASVMSDNKQYSSYEAEFVDLNIIGKVVWLAREL